MDNSINTQLVPPALPKKASGGAGSGQFAPQLKPKAEAPAPAQQAKAEEPRADVPDADRLKALRAAAAELFAVSDKRFTIYKQGGQFFTRFTSLRDGSVQTIPEPHMLNMAGKGQGTIFKTTV